MQCLGLDVQPMSNPHCCGQALVWSGEACALHNIANDLALQGVSQVGSFVDESAASVLVAGDGGKVPVRICEGGDYLSGIGYKKLFPHRTLVLIADSVRIGRQLLRFRKIRKFLVMKSGGCA